MAEEKKSVVWVQVLSTEWEKLGGPVEIELVTSGNVNGLRKAVKKELELRLKHADANELLVFRACTTIEDWKDENKALDPGDALDTFTGTTSKTALIVVAPSAPSQGILCNVCLRAVTDNCRYHLDVATVLCFFGLLGLAPPPSFFPVSSFLPDPFVQSLARCLDRPLPMHCPSSCRILVFWPLYQVYQNVCYHVHCLILIFLSDIVFSALP